MRRKLKPMDALEREVLEDCYTSLDIPADRRNDDMMRRSGTYQSRLLAARLRQLKLAALEAFGGLRRG